MRIASDRRGIVLQRRLCWVLNLCGEDEYFEGSGKVEFGEGIETADVEGNDEQ